MPTHAAAGRPKVNGEQVDLGKPQKPLGTPKHSNTLKVVVCLGFLNTLVYVFRVFCGFGVWKWGGVPVT